jgi:hypothetical protein
MAGIVADQDMGFGQVFPDGWQDELEVFALVEGWDNHQDFLRFPVWVG